MRFEHFLSSYTELQHSRVGVAHREADGGEYHPVSRLAGMRVCGHVGEQAYSKIAYIVDGEREEILRLPCRAALQDGRAGSISMSLEFLVLFFQEKSTEKKNHAKSQRRKEFFLLSQRNSTFTKPIIK